MGLNIGWIISCLKNVNNKSATFLFKMNFKSYILFLLPDPDGGFDQKWLNDEILAKWQESSRKKIVEHLQKSLYHDTETTDYDSVEQTTKNDPAYFAYIPPDPRYYEKQSEPSELI